MNLQLIDLAYSHQADLRAEAARERLVRGAQPSNDRPTIATAASRLLSALRALIAGLGGHGTPTTTVQSGNA